MFALALLLSLNTDPTGIYVHADMHAAVITPYENGYIVQWFTCGEMDGSGWLIRGNRGWVETQCGLYGLTSVSNRWAFLPHGAVFRGVAWFERR